MERPITVEYKSTTNAYIAKKWLKQLENYDILACDFETAIKYSKDELKAYKDAIKNEDLPYLQKRKLEGLVNASALDHPSHTTITHFSVAWSESEALVFVLDNPAITKVVLDFLITTDIIQIWHNASYDFRQIQYRTKKFPKYYEDTQILAKTLLNHVDTFKARTGLKELAGSAYGEWGISSEYFDIEHMHDEKVIKYSAIDPCATMWIWNKIQNYLVEEDHK